MITLSYGFQLPQSGDKGTNLFSALEANITQLNQHNHDGQNSSLLNAYSIKSGQGQALAANWASFGGPIGEYNQLMTMASGFTFGLCTMSFRTLDGFYCYPKVQRVSDTSYYVYTNDPTQTFNVVYGG